MVPRVHAGGKSFSGVVAYLTHDAGMPDDRRPQTAARVGMVALENLPACPAATAARIMAGTARDAAVLKELAGVSTRGRKLDKPVYHFSLSWSPAERPGRAEMLTAARGSLDALGMGNRQALVVEHTDCAHRHVHVVVNRVSPEDGRAASSSHDARTLSRWAQTWERERGRVRCPARRPADLERLGRQAAGSARTARRAAAKSRPAAQCGRARGMGGAAHPAPHRAGRRSRPSPHGAPGPESAATRGGVPPPSSRPPASSSRPASQRRRGPGRRDRTAAERGSWSALYTRHRTERDDVRDRHRAEREQLSLRHQPDGTQPAPAQKPPRSREDALRAHSGPGGDHSVPAAPPVAHRRGERGAAACCDRSRPRRRPITRTRSSWRPTRAEARLPTIQRSGRSLVALSDDTFRRLTAGTDDQFVKDTISAVSGRQPLGYSPPEYERFEEAYHRPAIDREHARRLADHRAEHGRRWWQLRRQPPPPEPSRRASAVAVIQRHLPQLRRIFEESCAWVRQQFQGRLAERRKYFDALSRPSPPSPQPAARPRPAVARSPDRNRQAGRASGRPPQPDPSPGVEQLLRERERVEKLYRDAMAAGRQAGRFEMEREARSAERALEREIGKLPWSEQREVRRRFQELERGREGPSR